MLYEPTFLLPETRGDGGALYVRFRERCNESKSISTGILTNTLYLNLSACAFPPTPNLPCHPWNQPTHPMQNATRLSEVPAVINSAVYSLSDSYPKRRSKCTLTMTKTG